MKPHILLIDDEDNFYHLFYFAFAKFYTITFAHTEALAKEKIKEIRFDLIITDLNLNPSHQDLTGLELIKFIKEKYPELPCLAITSVKKDYLPNRAFEVGANEYLHKDNFDFKDWKNTIDALIFQRLKTNKMTPKFIIVSDTIPTQEFNELLNQEIQQKGIKIELEKQPEDSMALDPFEVVATVLSAVEVLTPIIKGIFAVIETKINANKEIEIENIKATKETKLKQLDKEMLEIDAQKVIALANIEAEKAIELAKIEAEKQIRLAEIRIKTTEETITINREDLEKKEQKLDLIPLEKVKAVQALQNHK